MGAGTEGVQSRSATRHALGARKKIQDALVLGARRECRVLGQPGCPQGTLTPGQGGVGQVGQASDQPAC